MNTKATPPVTVWEHPLGPPPPVYAPPPGPPPPQQSGGPPGPGGFMMPTPGHSGSPAPYGSSAPPTPQGGALQSTTSNPYGYSNDQGAYGGFDSRSSGQPPSPAGGGYGGQPSYQSPAPHGSSSPYPQDEPKQQSKGMGE